MLFQGNDQGQLHSPSPLILVMLDIPPIPFLPQMLFRSVVAAALTAPWLPTKGTSLTSQDKHQIA